MRSELFFLASVLLIGNLIGKISGQASIARASRCSRNDHRRCASLADPLLKDPHLIFPDNTKDIDTVCRTWSSFVDCIKRYIDECFSKQRQEQFNSAVEIPIASVHQMCSVSTYQAEYLRYASCLKATVIDTEHCGNQYAALVDQVSKGEMAKTSLCCSHHHFRTCVIQETKRKCDENQSSGAAARFSRQILDKALSFLQDQCQNYIPSNADCPNAVTDSALSLGVSSIDEGRSSLRDNKGRSNLRTMSPDNYPGQPSNFHAVGANTAHPSAFKSTGRALDSYSTRGTETISHDHGASPTVISTEDENRKTTTPERSFHTSSSSSPPPSSPSPSSSSSLDTKVPSSTDDERIIFQETNRAPVESHEEPAIVVTQRPSNYGRGMSWTSLSTKQSAKTTTEIPAWATSTWLTSNQVPVTDESWYPAAGSFGGNHIDEPNQQGLAGNGQIATSSQCHYLSLLSVAIYFLRMTLSPD